MTKEMMDTIDLMDKTYNNYKDNVMEDYHRAEREFKLKDDKIHSMIHDNFYNFTNSEKDLLRNIWKNYTFALLDYDFLRAYRRSLDIMIENKKKSFF